MNVDFDKFGYCVKCHARLITTKVIEGVEKTVFLPERAETQFLLDDGSKMRVCICIHCKDKLQVGDYKEIMKSVVKGWEKEIENFPHWSTERKIEYIKTYSKKEIVAKSEGLDNYTLEDKMKKFKEKKEK